MANLPNGGTPPPPEFLNRVVVTDEQVAEVDTPTLERAVSTAAIRRELVRRRMAELGPLGRVRHGLFWLFGSEE